jgi:hypothetical protein
MVKTDSALFLTEVSDDFKHFANKFGIPFVSKDSMNSVYSAKNNRSTRINGLIMDPA